MTRRYIHSADFHVCDAPLNALVSPGAVFFYTEVAQAVEDGFICDGCILRNGRGKWLVYQQRLHLLDGDDLSGEMLAVKVVGYGDNTRYTWRKICES